MTFTDHTFVKCTADKKANLHIRQEITRTIGEDLMSLAQNQEEVYSVQVLHARKHEPIEQYHYTLHFDFQLDWKMKKTFSEIGNVGFYNF